MSALADPVLTEPVSRAATNDLLADLRAGRWRPAAVVRFIRRATHRSVYQAARRPRAVVELTLLHAALAATTTRRRGWLAASWLLAVSHLGLLEGRRKLSGADVVTVLRGTAPAVASSPGRWLPAIAVASDVVDGRLARATGTVSPFGQYADALADAAFWTWCTLTTERDTPARITALTAWATPVVIVTALSVARGSMVEAPRPKRLRPAAALQAVVAIRAMLTGPAKRGEC